MDEHRFETKSARSTFFDLIPGLILCLIMVWAVTRSIVVGQWSPGIDILPVVALPALVIGVIFAQIRRISSWLAHLLSAAIGIPWIIARLQPLLDPRLTTWSDSATELLIRMIAWGRVLANGGRGEDSVLFVLALALLSWMLGYNSAWLIFRRGWVWWAILLNALVILLNYTYVLPKPTSLFFVFLASALLLLVYHNIVTRQQRWSSDQIEYPELLPLRFVSAAACFCSTIIVVTSLLPGHISSEQAERTWETMKQPFVMLRERWENAFSTINSPPGSGGANFATRNTTLSGARTLGDAVVMYIRSSRYDYWRAVAFDRYTSQGWQNTTGEHARSLVGASTREQARSALTPGMLMMLNDRQGRAVITQTIQLTQDRQDDFVVVGGQAVHVSLPILVEHGYHVEQNRLIPNFDDTALIVAQSPLRKGTVYTVTALASVVDVQRLRQADIVYPDWVRRRYLQLPDTITTRTVLKAREIVRAVNARNAYDQATAIQDYLRTFHYNESISAPPADVDPVDYFLFERQEGYCDYYASAMVIMLRSLGVPARWVQGYAGGTFDPEQGVYVVRENVAHSWPEVYFPGYGWQRFEPTPASYTSLPARPSLPLDNADELVDRPLDEALESLILPEPDPMTPAETPFIPEIDPDEVTAIAPQTPRSRWHSFLLLVGILIGLIGIGVVTAVRYWRREVQGLRPAAAAYAQLTWLARWAGFPQRPHSTPYEYGAELLRALPRQRTAIRRIVSAYVRERYCLSDTYVERSLTPELRRLHWPLFAHILARLMGWAGVSANRQQQGSARDRQRW